MVSVVTWLLFAVLVAVVLAMLVVLFFWWIKMKKIKRNIPENIDVNSKGSLTSLNYDQEYIERRKDRDNARTQEEGKTEKIDRLERDIREQQERIRNLKGESGVTPDATPVSTGGSPEQSESIPSPSPIEDTTTRKEPKRSKRSRKSFRFKSV